MITVGWARRGQTDAYLPPLPPAVTSPMTFELAKEPSAPLVRRRERCGRGVRLITVASLT